MKRLRGLRAPVLAALLLVLTSVPLWGKDTVRLGIGEMPPYFSARLPGYGFLARVIAESFARQGVEVRFVFVPWNRALVNAASGSLDGTPGWFRTPEREATYLLCDPLILDSQSFFHLKTLPFRWASLGDLRGVTLGGTRGYSYGREVDAAIREGRLRVDWSGSDEANFRKLLGGRIRVFPMNTRVGLDLLRREFSPDVAASVTYHPKPLREEPLFLLLTRRNPRSEERLRRFNQGLKELKASGRYDELVRTP